MSARKIFALLTAVALLFSCAALAEEEPAKVQTGVYTIKNKTGEPVIEVKITDNVTGESNDWTFTEQEPFDADGLMILYFDIPEGENGEHRLTLSFKTKSGREEAFGTLSIEEVNIDLLAADAMTGATPIAFSKPTPAQTGTYTFYNRTGEVVSFINLIDNEDGAAVRLGFKDGFAPDESQVLEFSVPGDRKDVTLTLQFVTESGKIGTFGTLKIEEVPITLLDVDSVSGATPISFSAPN
jgi:hypothetical protein